MSNSLKSKLWQAMLPAAVVVAATVAAPAHAAHTCGAGYVKYIEAQRLGGKVGIGVVTDESIVGYPGFDYVWLWIDSGDEIPDLDNMRANLHAAMLGGLPINIWKGSNGDDCHVKARDAKVRICKSENDCR